MDIYSFLNSKDVRDHCRKIGYQFNAIEAAFIIHSCYRISLEEKLQLYRELMETMPDEKITESRWMLKRVLHEESDSFFEGLSQYISEMEKCLESFLKAEPGNVYKYLLFYADWDDPYEKEMLFSTYEGVRRAFITALDGFREDEEDRNRFIGFITKVKIDVEEEDYDCSAMVMPDGRITAIHDSEHDLSEFFSYMWVKIPVPFRKGDLLIGSNPFRVPFDFQCGLLGQEPMVFEKCCYEKITPKGEEYHGCDSSDMTAYGFWADEQGRIFPECMHYYHELEYYHGEIPPRMRLLPALSAHLKGETDVYEFLKVIEYEAGKI